MVKDQKTASSSKVKAKKFVDVKTNKLPVRQNGKVSAAPKVVKGQSGKSSPKSQPVEVKPARVKAEPVEKQAKPSGEDNKGATGKQGKRKLSKKQIGIIIGAVVVLVATLALVLMLALGGKKPATEDVDDTEVSQDETEVDYNQKVTDKNGGKFDAEYQAGSGENFAVRFADLKCEDGCKNVSEVKLGKKVLKLGEDYEVQRGSIIVVLTESLMEGLKEGKHSLIIAVADGGETKLYGVKFTVKAAPTCAEDEKLEKGECVKKDEEKKDEDDKEEDDASESQEVASSQTTQSTPSKSKAEIECENQAGPTGFYAVHWTSEDEFTDVTVSGTIDMRRVNAVCRPNVAQASGLTARDFSETVQAVSENTDSVVLEHRGRDIIVWFWGDGSTTVEEVSDARGVWSY